jgi:ribose 5-phosphate isomerase RpiB
MVEKGGIIVTMCGTGFATNNLAAFVNGVTCANATQVHQQWNYLIIRLTMINK